MASSYSVAEFRTPTSPRSSEFLAAKAMKSARLGDKAWCERWLAGGWNEGREMLLINTIVSSFQER